MRIPGGSGILPVFLVDFWQREAGAKKKVSVLLMM